MDNADKLKKLFIESLGIEEEKVVDNLKYDSMSQWDSVAHMRLVAGIDNEFNIMLDTEDIIDMSSFGKAKEILKKYGIEF